MGRMPGYKLAGANASLQATRQREIATRYYFAHLASEYYIKLKQEVSRLRGYRCEICFRVNPKAGPDWLQIHHKTYESFGRETVDDVMALCPQCHAALHSKQRVERLAGSDQKSVNSVLIARLKKEGKL